MAGASVWSRGLTCAIVAMADAPHPSPDLENERFESTGAKAVSKVSVRYLPIWLVLVAKNAIPRGTLATF